MNRLLKLILVFSIPAIAFAQISSSGKMDSSFNTFSVTSDLIGNAHEIEKIRYIVNEFLELRKIRNSPDALEKSQELDEVINSLSLFKKYCISDISTLELAFSQNPYGKLQETCPNLKAVDFKKAVSFWEMII